MNVSLSFYLLLFHFVESTKYYQKSRTLSWLKIVWLYFRKPCLCNFLKIRFFVSLIKLLQRFFELFKAKKFSLAGDLRYLFHVFDLFILVLLRSLVIKGVWFFRIFFCFRVACLFKAFRKILVKIQYISSLFW